MFRISRRLDYGIQLMVTLAESENGKPLATAVLSEKLDIPLPFLHQIGHTLMQNGLIKATPGPKGGLRLNRKLEEITILQISEALEGPLCVNSCVNCDGICTQENRCAQKRMWTELQEKLTNYLNAITLKDLVDTQNGRFTIQYLVPDPSEKISVN